MKVEVVVNEEIELVSLDLAKKHLRIDPNDTLEDEIIEIAIASAISQVENFTERPLKSQNTIIEISHFQSLIIERGSLVDRVTKVEIREADVDSILLPEATFKTTKQNAEVYELSFTEQVPALLPNQKVFITIDQGYTEKTIPKPIISAILLLIGDAFEKREDRIQTINLATRNLLRPYRKWQV